MDASRGSLLAAGISARRDFSEIVRSAGFKAVQVLTTCEGHSACDMDRPVSLQETINGGLSGRRWCLREESARCAHSRPSQETVPEHLHGPVTARPSRPVVSALT
jgi:hypothetical protein